MSIYVGESRSELMTWANNLLHPFHIEKVEQCGTGATYCQLVDSIFGDLPIHKVKFNAKHDYEYLDNFKILQKAFKQHGVDKPIPVDRLIKCRMQDNLEFLQWLKKYWDTTPHIEDYDAEGRAGGYVPAAAPVASTSRARAPVVAHTRAPVARAPAGRSVSSASNAQIEALHGQIVELEDHLTKVEGERDFYYAKLQRIETFVQERNVQADISQAEQDFLAKVSETLYSPGDGAEVAQNGEEGAMEDGESQTF